jgi:O-acetyl-ADP-ribose deacetylase (regulator of RNase III)/uncharacterized protein YwgA
MTIKYVSGDLLTYPAEAIINTINCVGVMGKGIALQFKHKYPENFKSYVKECKAGNVTTGKMLVYDCGMLSENPRYIINFPTKQHWRNNSKIEYITSGLDDLIKVIEQYKIKSIAIPQLGCGNGGLEWDEVRQIIIEKLSCLDIDINIFAPTPQTDQVNEKFTDQQFQNITVGRAILLLLMYHYQGLRYALTSLEVQKLAYFIKESGEPTLSKLNFEKNKFGPYSPDLKKVIALLVANEFVENFKNDESDDYQYKVSDHAHSLASAFLENNHDLKCVDNIQALISGYEYPFGMELLSTVHWVVNHEGADNIKSACHKVWNWSIQHPEWGERKKKLMPEKYIIDALNKLNMPL